MTLIEFAYRRQDDVVSIHAQVGSETSDILASVPMHDDETEAHAVIRAAELLFSDDGSWEEVQQLREEYNRHTHGQPDS